MSVFYVPNFDIQIGLSSVSWWLNKWMFSPQSSPRLKVIRWKIRFIYYLLIFVVTVFIFSNIWFCCFSEIRRLLTLLQVKHINLQCSLLLFAKEIQCSELNANDTQRLYYDHCSFIWQFVWTFCIHLKIWLRTLACYTIFRDVLFSQNRSIKKWKIHCDGKGHVKFA